jgi:ABC-type Na+ efflux pump permease subunit
VEERNENIPMGMNASSPGFAVMFVMMGVFFAGAAMIRERDHKTLARLLTTPTEKFFIISGKMLGFFLVVFIQFLILILFGQLVLKVNWGNLPLFATGDKLCPFSNRNRNTSFSCCADFSSGWSICCAYFNGNHYAWRCLVAY